MRPSLNLQHPPTGRVRRVPCFECGRSPLRDFRRRLCSRCYDRLRRSGHLPGVTWDLLIERLVMVTETGCWEWMGSISDQGYGAYNRRYLHRVTYELLVGLIPEGLHIDHLCRNRCCCNPAHLEPVTCAENCRRGVVYAQGLKASA